MPKTRSQTCPKAPSKEKRPDNPVKHPKGWSKNMHYFNLGGQCGQSCPCCRAMVGDILGACPICHENKQLLQFP